MRTPLPEVKWTPVFVPNPERRWWQVWKPLKVLNPKAVELMKADDILLDLKWEPGVSAWVTTADG